MAKHLSILLIGSGVIGSVYAGQFALEGHGVSVLAFGERERKLAKDGIRLKNVQTGKTEVAKVQVAGTSSGQQFDLVIVALRADQLASAFPALRKLKGSPHIVFFGNNPDGHKIIPSDLPGTVQLAFPGIGGSIVDDVVEYIPVDQQPTSLEVSDSPTSQVIHDVLSARRFTLQDIADMDGWLAHHTVFISCISVAILRKNGLPADLANDREAMRTLCRAIEEGFAMLKAQHLGGAPKNLVTLHSRWLRPIAVMYWSKLLRSPKGELYFGAHARHASDEVYQLATWTLARCPKNYDAPRLKHLLEQ
ncbi:hypothetical protein KC967_04360 [Candidatus Saccharibacteria bacterium]|nr:hypothetical protein [Candidatus Saccharibacteria bacterium]